MIGIVPLDRVVPAHGFNSPPRPACNVRDEGAVPTGEPVIPIPDRKKSAPHRF
jgi:hypothetical protein